MWQNIALICQYHQDLPEKKAQLFVIQGLKRFGLESIAYKRNPFLSEMERFCAMLLRAAMLPEAVIVIDRSFRIIPYLEDISFIYEALDKIDDMFTQCFIFDFRREKNRYGMIYESED